MIGNTIGSYRITEEIGAGGMGVVFRAHDSKLGRDVAVKVLSETLLADPERLARFQREAKLLASLNHPGIAGIYGLEESEGRQVIVMELVEGEDLSARLGRGPLSVGDAVRIARQVASALEAAHEGGVVHRDIKPANIKVTPAGAVKVLDFGLAKATEGDAEDVNLSHSPTITSAHRTLAGVILGTAAYMSPEQARGKAVDKRTDVWSFGCVLYECLTGRQAFAGETVTDTLARILERDPDWGALPSGVSPRLRRLLERCLQKDPAKRLRDIGDARIDLDEIASGGPEPVPAEAAPDRRRPLLWIGAGVLLGAVLAAAGLGLREQAPPPGPVHRLTMALPDDVRLDQSLRASLAMNPDGSGIVYSGNRKGTEWIFRRDFDSSRPEPIPDTREGSYPFFSPDGKWMGFSSHGSVVKVPVAGGTPIPIHAGTAYFGVAWTADGHLIAPTGLTSGLMRIPDSGGEATTLTEPAEGELGHWWPSLLPDGDHVVFTCWRTTLSDASVRVLSLDSGEQRTLLEGATTARYAPTGHLIYTSGSALMAVPFDPERLEMTGSPVVVVDSVHVESGDGNTLAAFGNDGTLVYLPTVSAPARWLAWVEPGPDPEHPRAEAVIEDERDYNQAAVSPDGRYLALGIESGTKADIWILDVRRTALTRFTFDGTNGSPLWTPDGKEITFRSLRNGPYEIFRKAADGSGEERLLYGAPHDLDPVSWSPDGRRLAFEYLHPDRRNDIWILDAGGDGEEPTAAAYVATEYDEGSPCFSPDGKWILYDSMASGRREVYLQASPSGGGREQVSVNGGRFPLWSPDGSAVIYWSETRMYRVPVSFSPGPEIGTPAVVLDADKLPGRILHHAVAPGGRSVMVLEKKGAERPFEVVQNWFQEVERLAGTGP
jgi:Tol biopolymer transport system component/tRNA A-37 threonylcarbamoyl transferase component Bud32